MAPSTASRGSRAGPRVVLILSLLGWLGVTGYLLFGSRPPSVALPDKVLHALLFAGLGWSAFALWFDRLVPARTAAVVVGGLLVVSPATELAQAVLTDNRNADPLDAVADLVGLAAAAALAGLVVLVGRGRAPAAHATLGASSLLVVVGLLSPLGTALLDRPLSCDRLNTAAVEDGSEAPLFTYDASVERGAAPPTGSRSPVLLDDAAEALCLAAHNRAFTLVVDVRTDDVTQDGPARLVSSSVGTDLSQVNFHLGQQHDALSIRLRTGAGPARATEQVLVPDVFVDTERRTLVLRYDHGLVTVQRDGSVIVRYHVDRASLNGWSLDYPVLVENELTLDRPFDGAVLAVRFYGRALSEPELDRIARSP